MKDSDLKRRLVSLAADARPFAHTTIEGLFSYYNLVQHGFPGWFTYGRSNSKNAFIELPPDAPDPSRQGYGQSSAGLDLTSRIGEVRVKQDINADWHLSVGVLDQRTDRDISTQVNALTNSTGSYTSSLATGFAPQFGVTSDLGYAERPVQRPDRSGTTWPSAARDTPSTPTRTSRIRAPPACSLARPASRIP